MVFWEMREGWGRKFWSISGLLTLKRGLAAGGLRRLRISYAARPRRELAGTQCPCAAPLLRRTPTAGLASLRLPPSGRWPAACLSCRSARMAWTVRRRTSPPSSPRRAGMSLRPPAAWDPADPRRRSKRGEGGKKKRGKTWLKWGSIEASSLWFPSPHPRRSCRWLDFNETFNWQQVHRWGFVSDRSCEGSISGVKRQLLDSSMKGVAFLQSELLLNESFWKKWVWKKNLKLVEAVSYPEVQIFCSILFLNWFFNACFVSFVQFADLQLIPKRTQLMEWS